MNPLMSPRFNRGPLEKAAYLRALAEKAFVFRTTLWGACSWLPDIAWLQGWYPANCWLSDLTIDEGVLFALFVAEALESEATV